MLLSLLSISEDFRPARLLITEGISLREELSFCCSKATYVPLIHTICMSKCHYAANLETFGTKGPEFCEHGPRLLNRLKHGNEVLQKGSLVPNEALSYAVSR